MMQTQHNPIFLPGVEVDPLMKRSLDQLYARASQWQRASFYTEGMILTDHDASTLHELLFMLGLDDNVTPDGWT
jgi:hypothetical protein